MVGAMSCSAPSGRSVKRRGSPLKFGGSYGVFGGNDERHRIGGVRRLRSAGRRIDHLLGVAVIGSDDHRPAALPQRACRSGPGRRRPFPRP